MADWGIEQKGFDALEVQLRKGADTSALKGAMAESLKILQQEASKFPPQPNRMRSGHLNTWVREVGRFPASHFITRSGALRKRPITRRNGLLQKSEMLLKKWKEAHPQITVTSTGITGKLTNAASYGGWVQGDPSKRPGQTKFHKATGWKTTGQIQHEQEARIVAVFKAALKLGK